MKKEVWLFRSKEWIAQNPNKPTMYKASLENIDKECEINNLVKKTRNKIKNQNKKVIAGTYLILCKESNTAYVGQSVNIHSRLRQHKYQLAKETNNSMSLVYLKMKKDIEKYGSDCLSFEVYEELENPTIETLLIKETELMHKIFHKGMFLYNTYIPFSVDLLYCPEDIKQKVKDFIKSVV
jgi:predicted GIY-YIG superfamily endonuclease